MPRAVVLGGGIVGLSTGMLLAERGCEVTVVERDPTRVPESPNGAWQDWDRPGVAQFRQPHYLHPAGSQLFATLLPSVHKSLAAAQARRFDVLSLMPPFITDRSPRDGDERFVTLTGRRPVIEYAVASAAADRLDIRRGTHATGLLDGAQAVAGVPHVTGRAAGRRQRTPGRPGHRRHGAAVAAARLAGRHRGPQAGRGSRRLRVHLLHPQLPAQGRGRAAAVPDRAAHPVRVFLAADPARRRGHLVGDGVRVHPRPGAEGNPPSGQLAGRGGRVPAARTSAGRGSDHRRRRDGRRAG